MRIIKKSWLLIVVFIASSFTLSTANGVKEEKYSATEKKIMEDSQLNPIDSEAKAVLTFWFGEPGSAEYGKPRSLWFQKDTRVDEEITQRFSALHQAVSRGEKDSWQQHPQSLLALIIVLDQFSRHIYRDSAAAFSSDKQALSLAMSGVDQGFDQKVEPIARVFYYLPFEHSEDIVHQRQAMTLFTQLSKENSAYTTFLDYAKKHYDVIAQFGRFPHRNAVLGRVSSTAEQQYLSESGSGF